MFVPYSVEQGFLLPHGCYTFSPGQNTLYEKPKIWIEIAVQLVYILMYNGNLIIHPLHKSAICWESLDLELKYAHTGAYAGRGSLNCTPINFNTFQRSSKDAFKQ